MRNSVFFSISICVCVVIGLILIMIVIIINITIIINAFLRTRDSLSAAMMVAAV